MKIKIIMGLAILMIAPHVAATTYHIRHIAPLTAVKKEVAGPDFWMFKGAELAGKYPSFNDAASDGAGKGWFNFGQQPFLGDPLGYQPYDPDFDKRLLKGTFTFEGEVFVPSNLTNVRYMKSYNTGKYYFETKIVQASISDRMGFTNDKNNSLCFGSTTYSITDIGTYRNKSRRCDNKDQNYLEWAKFNIVSGDTLQIWVDFDKGNLLIKKLGTTKEDYVNIE